MWAVRRRRGRRSLRLALRGISPGRFQSSLLCGPLSQRHGVCSALPWPFQPHLPPTHPAGTGLLSSKDIQLDTPSWLGTVCQPVPRGGDSSARTARVTEAAKSLVSEGLLIQESSEKKLQRRWFQNSKIIFRGKEGAREKPHP